MIAGKSGYLNPTFWLIRAAVFLIGWNLYRYMSRKNCLAQDESNDNSITPIETIHIYTMKYIEEILKDTIIIEDKKKDIDKEIEELEKRVKELREYIETNN